MLECVLNSSESRGRQQMVFCEHNNESSSATKAGKLMNQWKTANLSRTAQREDGEVGESWSGFVKKNAN